VSAAAGMVVTDMNTPMIAPARASVSDTIPTMPASTAMTTENRFGAFMRLETGLMPSSKRCGVLPSALMHKPNTKDATIADRKPQNIASSPVLMSDRSCLSIPSATPMMAPYSGPTTMAPTMRICEFASIPVLAISPAMTSNR
jgi:hypothetical protein